MTRKGESITLSLTTAEKAELEALALLFGCTWGEKPNVSALLKAIAAHKIKLIWSDETPDLDIKRKKAVIAIEKIKNGLDELKQSF